MSSTSNSGNLSEYYTFAVSQSPQPVTRIGFGPITRQSYRMGFSLLSWSQFLELKDFKLQQDKSLHTPYIDFREKYKKNFNEFTHFSFNLIRRAVKKQQ